MTSGVARDAGPRGAEGGRSSRPAGRVAPAPLRALAAGVVLLAALLGTGCATKGDVTGLERTMRSEMEEVREAQRELAARIGASLDTLAMRESQAMTGRGQLQREFDRIQELLSQLLTLVDQNHRLLGEIRRGGGVAAGGREAGGPVPADEEGEGGGARDDEARTFYQAALQQHRRGAYETARGGFQDFLENYPDHELAPDAQFWLAETWREGGDLERSLEELRRVWQQWPDSRRAPTALYRAGRIELERGNVSDARVFFQRVTAGYPNSAEAPLAEEQLRTLRP